MSKLMKRLHQICDCSSPPMGFKKGAVQPDRHMALLVSLPQGRRSMAGSLDLAEIDAVLFHGSDLAGAGLQEVSGVLSETPWGAWLGAGESPDLEQMMEAGGDFIALESPLAAAGLLQEDVGSILKVDLSGDRFLLSAMSDLPVGAVLMGLGQGKGGLTVADLMRCQWLASLLDKPLLVAANQELSDKEMRLIWDMGVSGIVVEVADDKGKEVLARESRMIKDLPPRSRKRSEDRVLLPSIDVESDED